MEDTKRIFDKLENMNTNITDLLVSQAELKKDITYIKVNVDVNSQDLKEHIRRTNISEQRLDQLENLISGILRPKGFWVWLRRNYKFLIGIATLISLFAAALKFVLSFV